MNVGLYLAERGLVPDALIRQNIRKRLARRLKRDCSRSHDEQWREFEQLWSGPIAVDTAAANEQHYELPPAYFERVLGPRLKYSGCTWPEGAVTLAEAEEYSLQQVAARAQLADGQRILDLGCGWGSFALWAAENYRSAQVMAVSNSAGQQAFIEARARERALGNLSVLRADINDFAPEGCFDRVVTIEMLEHVRNHRRLMERIAGWLQPEGKLFVHVFAHAKRGFLYETEGDWMARFFFSGGVMPSHALLPRAAEGALEVEEDWRVPGIHYARTLERWLEKHDAQREAVLEVFRPVYGARAGVWFNRWRLFYMACAELFGYRNGREWAVSHYRFRQA